MSTIELFSTSHECDSCILRRALPERADPASVARLSRATSELRESATSELVSNRANSQARTRSAKLQMRRG